MNFPWLFLINLGIISLALLLATLIRVNIRFFQKYLIPNSLTAGFILLIFYNYIAPFFGLSQASLGHMVYHLLSISFIAMSLRKAPLPREKGGKGIVSTSISIIFQYSVQALTGLLLTFFFIKTFIPDLFPSFGFFLPLGFALGPGQAYAIGQGWEEFGFKGAGSVGLTFAALGFIWACFGGMYLINYGLRKNWIGERKVEVIKKLRVKSGVYPKDVKRPVGSHLTTESEAIDSMTLNSAVVFGTYLLSYLFLKFLTWLLSFAGKLGMDLAVNLWGISFVFAALTALAVRKVFHSIRIDYVMDNGCLTRISGFAVDVMVAASLGAISIVVVRKYWLPILVISTVGGIIISLSVPWFCSRIFRDHKFHRTLIVYGASTGTMPTGLALLRVIDPQFETPVASDYMFSSAVTFVLVIPFILAINLPAYSYAYNKPLYFWLAIFVAFAYFIFTMIMHKVLSGKSFFKRPLKIWFYKTAK
ncbi:MAG: sodium:glutamate symporter [Candidatus Neomarinimicrobiota bacterium]|nr:MAG: sodium:glutamate symporter [Candidatus Neomarinimicrobiota bacterium]